MTAAEKNLSPQDAAQTMAADARRMEEGLIYALLSEQEAIGLVAGRVRHDMFSCRDLALVYRAIHQLWKGSRPIDFLTIEQEMVAINRERTAALGGLTFLSDQMLGVHSAAHIETYAAHVISNWTLRQVIYRLSRHIARASEPAVDALTLFGTIHHDVEELEQAIAGMEPICRVDEHGRTVIRDIADEQQRRLRGESAQIASGITEYDKLTGGLYRGELLVIGARPSMGKTAVALHIAQSVARAGYKAVFFSLEMTIRQMMNRILAALAGVDPEKLRFGTLTREEWGRLSAVVNKQLSGLPLFLEHCGQATVDELRARIMLMKRREGIDMFIVDYLNLVRIPAAIGRDRFDTMDLALGDVVQQVKALTMELGVAGVLLTQLNRQCEHRVNHRPMLSDLRNSGVIEQVADSIAFLYRPEVYGITFDPETQTDLHGHAEMILAKNRNGGIGTAVFRFEKGSII